MATQAEGRALGWTLVGIQGALFAAVPVAALAPGTGPVLWQSSVAGAAILAVGVAAFVASVLHLGSALTPHPEPNLAGLVARGVYRHVRHPMYSALVAIVAGVAVATGRLASYVVTVALAALFALKTRVEERYLIASYDGYAAYARDTGKFIPGVGRHRP